MVVLVATLKNECVPDLVKQMNLTATDTIVVNQWGTERSLTERTSSGRMTVLESNRIGLSASRNDAISLAKTEDICQLADDDMVFVDDYDDIVAEAYQKIPEADIIVFYIEYELSSLSKKKLPAKKLNYLSAMKVSSCQITFKKSKIEEKELRFDERFGIGAKYTFGEENIFLFDALRSGLSVYSYPVKIARLRHRESYWDRTPNKTLSRKRGAVYKRMSPVWYWVLILQFAVRKRKLVKPHLSMLEDIKYMFQGAREFQASSKISDKTNQKK
ncbi:TPA: glycosyltransferase family 2 protein [Streptococcus suis]